MDKILTQKEVIDVVKSLQVSKLDEIGYMKWFTKNEKIMRMYQVAMIQAKNSDGAEDTKDVILEEDKVVYFIVELITLSVWREKIFTLMITFKPKPDHSFPVYMILYHEVILVGLLQTLLFHSDICKSLGDSAIDLVDYSVCQLISLQIKREPNLTYDTSNCKNSLDVILAQNQIISFNIAVQCLPILRYIVEYLDDLPLSVSSHVYSTHDVPVLIASLLYNDVWSHRGEDGTDWKYCEISWREWYPDDPALCPTECQAWLLLHQLLTHKNSSVFYEYTNYRKEQLSRLTPRLNDRVTDMLSPLVSLKTYLNHITMNSVPKAKTTDKPLLIELSSRIRDNLINLPDSDYRKMAKDQAKLLFYGGADEIQRLAVTMAETFGMLEEVSANLRTCHYCFQKATKKCSKCKKVWYCSRDCQIQHWKAHKNICL